MQDVADFAVRALRANGASYAEAKFQSIEANSFLVKNNALDLSSFDEVKGIGIRFLCHGAMGFFSTNVLEKSKILSRINESLARVKQTKKSERVEFSEEKAHTAKYEVKQKIKLQDTGPDEKIGLLFGAEKLMRSAKAGLASTYLHYHDIAEENYYVNSDGSRIQSKIPRVMVDYIVSAKVGGKLSQRYWAYGGTGGFEAIKKHDIPEILKKEVVAMSSNLRLGKPCPKKIMDVIVGPQVAGIIAHESCGHPHEADRIFGREAAQAGESFISRKMVGKKIGSSAATIADDPIIEGSHGYYLFDDEGVKARRKYILQEGRITEFLYNRQTARMMGLQSNGSARANAFDKEPLVRMSNTFFLPGDQSEEELIEDVKEGILMNNFMEWNIDDRRENQKYVGAEAFFIRNGKVLYPVRAPTIEITTQQLYPAIDACGNNLELHVGDCGKGEPMQGIPVTLGGPSLRIRKIAVR
ncbi:TldD/PmbA family protein [Candidatus Woesearchaeota archaeon]|nr:TldD/PmbA family protein [Candidatus Woesearchaeota archaeon]